MEYFTKKEVVEMYKKGKKVANLKAKSYDDVLEGILFGSVAIGAGVVACLLKSFFCGIGSAVMAYGSYVFFRDAHRDGKKAEGLEKEIEAELEKEVKI